MNRLARLEKLEARIAPNTEPWVQITVEHGESTAEVISRTYGDNPPRNLLVRKFVEAVNGARAPGYVP